MSKRGAKPKGKVKIKWSSKFAYAIGLLVTDGSLSNDGRHINFTSKDRELVILLKDSLMIDNHIGKKARVSEQEKKYFVIQFGDVLFYSFLCSIGLMPCKSKKLTSINIPDKYFFDFLRGHFDGDGTFYSYWDPRWKSSFMFYTVFVSASEKHIQWLQNKIYGFLKIKGHINHNFKKTVYELKYAKKESLSLLTKMYYDNKVSCLSRKKEKIKKALKIDEYHQ